MERPAMSGAAKTRTGPERVDLEIQGMHCASCVARIEGALSEVDGVEKASVNLATGRASVLGAQLEPATLSEAVERAGYEGRPVSDGPPIEDAESDQERRARAELRALRRRFVLAAGVGAVLL